MNRKQLRQDLLNAWKHTIRTQYCPGFINSERALQAYYCMALAQVFKLNGRHRRLFIEPTLSAQQGAPGPRPDIVICNRNRIIGVVEIKYLPRERAKTRKDLRTLEWCMDNCSRIAIKNDRFMGPGRPIKAFPIAHDAVLCWAGVYNVPKGLDLMVEAKPAIRAQLLGLHAETRARSTPRVFATNANGDL